MQFKFFRSLHQVYWFSFTLIFFSLTPKLLHAKELEAPKNDLDAAQPTTGIPIAQVPRDTRPPSLEPLPEQQPLPTPPPPEQLLPPPVQEPNQLEPTPGEAPATLIVKEFKFEGNTVFSDAKLAETLKNYIGRRISFAQLLQARTAITELYSQNGYTTSGAILPPQKISNPDSAVVTIRVVEGSLERINVTGTRRLRPGYIRSRLELAETKPLNVNSLLEKLQLLQLDPLIISISADLQAGTRPGTNILQVRVTEADSLSSNIILDNSRSPTVGSFRRQIVFNQANLLGFGDALSISYSNTNGSNTGDLTYSFPVTPNDSQLILNFGITNSNVIEKPFDVLDISSEYRYYELTYRHPIIRNLTQELALGLTFSHQRSQSFLGFDDIGPFPLAPGADDRGRTNVSAVRFFQEWTKQPGSSGFAIAV